MHLDLGDLPRGPQVLGSRPIVEEDLAEIEVKRALTPERKQLKYKHHALARSLASGMQESAAAAICGFAPVTVSILKASPMFAELLKFYESENGKGFDEVRAQMLGVGQKLIEEIERRVDEEPEELTMKELRETTEVLMDRAGYAPAQNSTHDIHIHSGLADALRASRTQAPFPAALPQRKGLLDETEALPQRTQNEPDVIEGEFTEVTG